MAKDNKVWFHCGQCGQLFRSVFGLDRERTCEACGQKARTENWPPGANPGEHYEWKLTSFEKTGERLEADGRRAVRKRHRASVMMRLVMAWIVLMLSLLALREYFHVSDGERLTGGESVSQKISRRTLADQKTTVLNEALPDCHRALSGFLTAGTPESRNQFVASPVGTAGKMAKFYRDNPFPNVRIKTLLRTAAEIVQVGDERMIFTRWREDVEEGLEFDAVFRKESDSWKLDWRHFSRFSEFPWTLFLAGDGPDEAEFRLLARRYSRGDRAEKYGARVTFVMFDPNSGTMNEDEGDSTVFRVDRRSDAGLLLDAAFEAKSESKPLFGSEFSSAMEPGDLVRIRVRVKREQLGGVRRFEIKEIPACHWIDTAYPGFDLEVLKDDLFGGS